MVSDERIAPAGRSKPSSSSSLCAFAQHRLMIEQPAPRHFVAEENIARHRQVPAEHDLLMDGVDAEPDRLVRIDQRDRLAAPKDFAGGSGIDAGQQLDQGRLARAVFADDRMDFALFERQIHRLERMGRAEAFVELVQDEERRAVAASPAKSGAGMDIWRSTRRARRFNSSSARARRPRKRLPTSGAVVATKRAPPAPCGKGSG